MNEVIFSLVFLLFILLHKMVEKFCLKHISSKWTYYFYLLVSFSIALPFVLMLKDGWVEKVGLEKSAGLVIIIGIAVFYFPFAVSRFLKKLDSPY